jgi:hypothetical protein
VCWRCRATVWNWCGGAAEPQCRIGVLALQNHSVESVCWLQSHCAIGVLALQRHRTARRKVVDLSSRHTTHTPGATVTKAAGSGDKLELSNGDLNCIPILQYLLE